MVEQEMYENSSTQDHITSVYGNDSCQRNITGCCRMTAYKATQYCLRL